jgi:superfamily I DNA/RNA helicase
MRKINLYQLKNIESCAFKAYISQFDKLKTIDTKSKMIRKVYKDIILENEFKNSNNLKDIILEKLDDKYFITKEEKLVEANIILNHLQRYFDYESSLNRTVINKKVSNSVIIGNVEINLNVDVIFETNTSIELIKYETNVPELSYKARTDKNLPQNNIELYLLKKLGEKLYLNTTNKKIIASFYHLKGKKDEKDIYKQFLEDEDVLKRELYKLSEINIVDKKEQKEIDKKIKELRDVLYFNNSIGNNIISFDYDNNLDNIIIDLLNTELDFNSNKCKSKDCDFCNYSILCNYNTRSFKNELEVIENIKKSESEIRLNDTQTQVVNIENGNYRINACCGTGKSTTMVMRTIELVKKGYSPDDILLITFTNKGCEELKEKIAYWLKVYNVKHINKNNLNIFTFNSFGENIISKEWCKLEFSNQPELATLIDINDTIKELLEESPRIKWLNYKNPLLNYPNAKGCFIQLLLYFNIIKSFDYDKNTFIKEILLKESDISEMENKADIIYDLYNKFNQKLKERNLLQYQDQVLYIIELLTKHKNLINTYGYSHIIVDEYQDTDFIQVKVIQLLMEYNNFKSLMVVGDSSQAIYGFRLTTPENIIKFHENFENTKDIYLLDNYRSTPQICEVANNLDKLNTERIDKQIISKRNDGEIPKLIKCKTLDEEYKYITNIIKEKINNNVPNHELCFIARTKKELLDFQTYLNENNIPSILEVSELYIDNINVQVIINLANFFRNNEYTYYLLEYLNLTNENLFANSKENIILNVENLKSEIIDALSKLNNENEKINYFHYLISHICEKDEIANIFMNNLKRKTFYTFNDFLNYLHKINIYQDDTAIEKDENRYNAVILTTAHSSKGKEWKIVFNSINNYKYEEIIGNNKLLEEERRLLFVSITRSKDELYITYNTSEDKTRNKGKYTLFAEELDGIKMIEV